MYSCAASNLYIPDVGSTGCEIVAEGIGRGVNNRRGVYGCCRSPIQIQYGRNEKVVAVSYEGCIRKNVGSVG